MVTQEDRPYTVMVPYQEQRQAERTVCRQVVTQEERPYTVMVPYQEKRKGERTVCKYVPTTETHYVCRDLGHWATVNYCNPCNPCCTWSSCYWVPKVVHEPVAYTVMRPQVSTVPYDYRVTVCRPETRVAKVNVCSFVHEKVPYDYRVTLCRPETRVATVNVCSYVHEKVPYDYWVTLCRPEQRVKTVNVCS